MAETEYERLVNLVREIEQGKANPQWVRNTNLECSTSLAELAKIVGVADVLVKVVSYMTNYHWGRSELINYIDELVRMYPPELRKELEECDKGDFCHKLITLLLKARVLSLK